MKKNEKNSRQTELPTIKSQPGMFLVKYHKEARVNETEEASRKTRMMRWRK